MAVAVRSELDDEEYEAISDYDMSELESDLEDDQKSNTPPTESSTARKTRPSDRKTLSCPYDGCSKTFNRKARLNEHLRSHTNTRPFKCPHCPKDFLRDSHLKHHVKSAHSKIRDYICSHEGCGKQFATGTRLRRHEATHVSNNKYKCAGYEGCNEIFRKKETLNKHVLQVHQNTNPFPCTEIDSRTGEPCKKNFDTPDKLKKHEQSMHDPTKFSCAICLEEQTQAYRDSKSTADFDSPYFPTYAALKRHIEAEHPPACSLCQRPFQTMKEVARHLELVHDVMDADSVSKKDSFECLHSGCGRFFTKRGNLNVHIRTVHEKRRDFVCGQTEVSLPEMTSDIEVVGCGRGFTSKNTLEEHIRSAHLGLQAKRVRRNQKRKAERQEAEDDDESVPRTRRPRKDKGIKKTSTIEALAGFPMYRHSSNVEPEFDQVDEAEESDAYSVYDDDDDDDVKEDDDDKEEAGLTGSMVMHGSQLFHAGNILRYDSSSSSFSVQQREESVSLFDDVNPPLKGDPLPVLNFDNMAFGSNLDFSAIRSHDMPAKIIPVDWRRQPSASIFSAEQDPAVDETEEELCFALTTEPKSARELITSGISVDPRLL